MSQRQVMLTAKSSERLVRVTRCLTLPFGQASGRAATSADWQNLPRKEPEKRLYRLGAVVVVPPMLSILRAPVWLGASDALHRRYCKITGLCDWILSAAELPRFIPSSRLYLQMRRIKR